MDQIRGSVGCKAVVAITVEVTVGSWGAGCELSQVYQQASREAVEKLKKLTSPLRDVRLVGDPTVTTVITNS